MPPPGFEPFLRAICADPEDDTVRLAYADWLDENGDPDRAEFIRVSIACALSGNHPKNAGCRRAPTLLKSHSVVWLNEVTRAPSIDLSDFKRGFLSTVSLRSTPQFGDVCDRILAATPITKIKLIHCRPPMIGALTEASRLRHVQQLEAPTGWVDDAALEALAACPDTNSLVGMTLACEYWCSLPAGRGPVTWVTERGATALANSSHLLKLRSLTLRHTHFGPAAVAALRDRFGSGVVCYPSTTV